MASIVTSEHFSHQLFIRSFSLDPSQQRDVSSSSASFQFLYPSLSLSLALTAHHQGPLFPSNQRASIPPSLPYPLPSLATQSMNSSPSPRPPPRPAAAAEAERGGPPPPLTRAATFSRFPGAAAAAAAELWPRRKTREREARGAQGRGEGRRRPSLLAPGTTSKDWTWNRQGCLVFDETNDTMVYCAKNVNAFPLSLFCLSWRILPLLPPCARMREREKGRYYCTILLPGGASVRGKQELSVCGNGKIFCMWKKADLCTTWKVIFCHYVENPYALTAWKIDRERLMRI